MNRKVAYITTAQGRGVPIMTMESKQRIAVLVSTRDRAHVAAWTRAMIDRQNVRSQVWVVVVDGTAEDNRAAWSWADCYLHRPSIPLGGSRNTAIEAGLAAGAAYLALWDDDDYYAPDHLESMVAALEATPSARVAGASLTPLYYLADGAVMVAGPYCEGHALEPTLVFRASYLREEEHRFLPTTRGLSAEILEGYRTPLVQVWGTMIVICHGSNTYDKTQIRERPDCYRAREVWGSTLTPEQGGDAEVPPVVWELLEWMDRGHLHPMLHVGQPVAIIKEPDNLIPRNSNYPIA